MRDKCYKLNDEIKNVMMYFLEKYYSDEDGNIEWEYDILEDGHSDMMNWTLYINDMYWWISDIYTALRYDMPREVLDKWYWWRVEGKIDANLKNYFLYSKE